MALKPEQIEKYFEKEFCKRTLEILKSYNGDYDVALLINSMVGLLIVPSEDFFRNNINKGTVLNRIRETSIFNQLEECIEKNTYRQETISPFQLIKHMRNAVCHARMKIICNSDEGNLLKNIEKIRFEDYYKYDNEQIAEFKMVVSIDKLKAFLQVIAENICNE